MALVHPSPVSWLRATAWFLLGAALFTTAYTQAPLYFSNQNQYFVHGLAAAGYGSLDRDWLANTRDPTPLFTLLVEGTYPVFGTPLFYVYYALLMGIYLASLLGIFNLLAADRGTPLTRALFLALVLLVHSAVVRAVSARMFGVDYPWYFQAGLAGQYVLGPILQPSCFGVLLLLSLYLFGRGRPLLAVTCSSLGAVCHATYLLPAALLTIAYLAVLVWERSSRQALLVGVWALVLVLPSISYILLTFRPSSPENFAQAQELMVHFRLPHHCVPALWFDGIAAAQVSWILIGSVLARGTRLFPVLLIAFGLALALTLLQVATGSNTLALLFPWRLSVILVPAATAIILTRVVLLVADRFSQAAPQRMAWAASLVVIALVVAGGVVIMVFRLGFQERDEELEMMHFVQSHPTPGAQYLLPVQIPELEKTVRGAAKSDFIPLRKLDDPKFIPLDLQRFRLITGTPIFVDFKSIPYWDRDVLNWHERLMLTKDFYAALKAGKFAQVLPQLQQWGITHIVVRAAEKLDSPQLSVFYEDEHYRIYQLVDN
jgi:hypothetical protein